MGLTGDAARFLGALALRAGQFVHQADLRDADVRTRQLAPLVTKVRRAFDAGILRGHIDRDFLVSRLHAVGVDTSEISSNDKLMLKLIDNLTDYGYRLRLLPGDVLVERP